MLFPVILMQHVIAQAKAVGMIYCGKQAFTLSESESTKLSCAAWALVLAGACKLAIPFGFLMDSGTQLIGDTVRDSSPLRLATPNFFFGLSCLADVAALVAVYVFARCVISRGVRTGEWLPLPARLMWISLVALILLPQSVTFHAWIFTPLLFRATQHWCVSWITRQQEARSEGVALGTGLNYAIEFFSMVLPVLAVTLAILFFPLFFMAENETGAGATLGVSLAMAVLYFHYFSDRIVWAEGQGDQI